MTSVERAVRMIENADLVALDLETTGLDPREADIRLVQVSDGTKIFVLDAFKRDVGPVFKALSREDLTVLAHGGDFEWRFVYHHFGIALENIADTMLMTLVALAGDRRGFGLGDIVKEEFGIELDKEMQTADWTVDPLLRRQLDYAAWDVKVLPPLYDALRESIAENEQERVAEIENAALPAFAKMQYVGMPVDKEAWDARAEKAERVLKRFERHMLDATWMPERPPIPQEWKLQGPDCLAMLEAAGYKNLTGTTSKDLSGQGGLANLITLYRSAPKGEKKAELKARVLARAPKKPPKPAPPWNFGSWQQVLEIASLLGFDLEDTGVKTLLRYRDEHPFFAHMLTHRKLDKLVGTYGKGWFQKAYSSETGRVYPAWRQIGTTTGRVASGEKNVAPNAQNLPNDGPYRSFFVAPEGRVLVDADYSQIEVRILAKMLEEERLLAVYGRPGDEAKSGDVYRETAAHMLDVPPETVTKEQRNLAKAIVLGMNYGLSAYGLPGYLFTNLGIEGVTVDEAQEYVDAFYDLYPKIRDYHKDTLDTLNDLGSVDQRTMTGRLRSEITDRNEAINAPIQGTSADVLKRAMALVYDRLKGFSDAHIVASIHDELLVECYEEDAEPVREILVSSMMEAAEEIVNAEEPKIKIEVDATVGKRWEKG
jgi:DNA polymerase I-like protein with 3'-5' exonuclease and polymerase domains